MDSLTTPKTAPLSFWAWLLSVLSEESGHGSWSRVQGGLSFALVAALLAISTWTGHDIPSGAQTVLLGLLAAAGVGYGANVGSAALAARKSPQEEA